TSEDVSFDDDWYTATEEAPAGDLAATVQSECLPWADAGASSPSWDAPCMEDSMAGTVCPPAAAGEAPRARVMRERVKEQCRLCVGECRCESRGEKVARLKSRMAGRLHQICVPQETLPLGCTVGAHYQVMESNAEASDFIFHHYHFVRQTVQLTPEG